MDANDLTPDRTEESQALFLLEFAEIRIADIIAARKGLPDTDRDALAAAFAQAFSAIRDMTGEILGDDYRCRNLVMGVSTEASPHYVASKVKVDLDSLLEDLRFIPTAIRSGVDLPRGDEVPRSLRAARLCWEAAGRPDLFTRDQAQRFSEYFAQARQGMTRNLNGAMGTIAA